MRSHRLYGVLGNRNRGNWARVWRLKMSETVRYIVIAVITVAMIMTMHNAMISFVCFLLSLLVI